jgi:hypothetical protein
MLSDDGQEIVRIILRQRDSGAWILHTEMSLKALSRLSGISPQNIGMAFDPHILLPLKKAGIRATKCGSPVRIPLLRL